MKIHSLARRACITQAAIVVLGSLLVTAVLTAGVAHSNQITWAVFRTGIAERVWGVFHSKRVTLLREQVAVASRTKWFLGTSLM